MSRILMINPPFYRLLNSKYNAAQLGIGYIASYLNANGHDAWTYNADHVSEKEYKNLKGLFGGFADYKNYFNNQNHQLWDEIVEKIVSFKPDFVGWFCYTAAVPTIKVLSKKLKERLPSVVQVVGGPHSSMDRGLLDRLPDVDYACIREGEDVMLQLVNGVDPNLIQGLVSRTLSGLHQTNPAAFLNRDNLPFPERVKMWGIPEEEKSSVDVSYIIRTLGCPHRCSYCASPQAWGRRTQMRSNESVLGEVKYVVENFWNKKQYDYSASANTSSKDSLVIKDNSILYFVDDIFPLKKKQFIPLLQSFIDSGLNFPWKCESRADLLDKEICEKMVLSNCQMVKIGFETGSDRILKQIYKRETREDYIKAAHLCKETGLKIGCYLMCGFHGETDQDLEETISLAKHMYDLGVVKYFSLSVLAPYYGTQIYFDMVDKGYHLNDDNAWHMFYHQTFYLLFNDAISEEKLKDFLSLANLNDNYV